MIETREAPTIICVCGESFWSDVVAETDVIVKAKGLVQENAPVGYKVYKVEQCVLCGCLNFTFRKD